jgi:hypothetical protein
MTGSSFAELSLMIQQGLGHDGSGRVAGAEKKHSEILLAVQTLVARARRGSPPEC